MKETLFLAGSFLCASLGASASTVLINFGNVNVAASLINEVGDSTVVDASSRTWNQVTQRSISGQVTLQTSEGTDSGISMSGSCGTGIGDQGTFNGGTAYTGESNLLNKYRDNYSTGWQGGINGGNQGANVMNLSFSLHAGQTYTFTLLSARANSFNDNNLENSWFKLSPSVDGAISGLTTILTTDAGSIAGSSEEVGGVNSAGGASGENAAEVSWTFTVTEDTDVTLTSPWRYNLNMLEITTQAVPEPATASLGMFGVGFLLLRRRRS